MKKILNNLIKKDEDRNITISKNGITLISLVITIIILIILAGIVINLTIGERGIFNKAKLGKENYMISANEEMQMITNLDKEIIVSSSRDNNLEKQYSTEEKIIGKWIDDKPIYQKTYILKNVSENGIITIDEDAKNYVDTFTNSEYRMTREGEAQAQLANAYDDSGSHYAEVWFSKNHGFYIYGNYTYPAKVCHITVQYTKITD